jgi:hypothetical protein
MERSSYQNLPRPGFTRRACFTAIAVGTCRTLALLLVSLALVLTLLLFLLRLAVMAALVMAPSTGPRCRSRPARRVEAEPGRARDLRALRAHGMMSLARPAVPPGSGRAVSDPDGGRGPRRPTDGSSAATGSGTRLIAGAAGVRMRVAARAARPGARRTLRMARSCACGRVGARLLLRAHRRRRAAHRVEPRGQRLRPERC